SVAAVVSTAPDSSTGVVAGVVSPPELLLQAAIENTIAPARTRADSFFRFFKLIYLPFKVRARYGTDIRTVHSPGHGPIISHILPERNRKFVIPAKTLRKCYAGVCRRRKVSDMRTFSREKWSEPRQGPPPAVPAAQYPSPCSPFTSFTMR